MKEIGLFCEDDGHAQFLPPLIDRLAVSLEIEVRTHVRHAAGGAGAALTALRQYARDLTRGSVQYVDILVAAVDGNSYGPAVRKGQIERAADGYAGILVAAVPDPHIEAWFVADRTALPRVLGERGAVNVPGGRRIDYKQVVVAACRELGTLTVAGGVEYAGDIARASDLTRGGQTTPSMRSFVSDMKAALRRA